ncbi:hypothetical protein C1H46_022244 [Malus baccata]|uniref:Uncharacterized protein n=1 Tax=Malus baccata TaxID=106549 RepID=A0A540M0C9_MALBA|nr:hypothetical protein C1H46_022244 [Malus baccata]
MGSEGSHNTQNDIPLASGAKQRKNEQKKFALQAKVDELEAQNNKITMKNEILQKQYEKVFKMLHEARYTKHTISSPLWKSTINWVPLNTEGHLPSTWVFLLRSELLIKMATNMRLLSTQLLRLEA